MNYDGAPLLGEVTENRHSGFPLKRLFSQYWWTLFALVVVVLRLGLPSTRSSGRIDSAKADLPWDDAEDPIVFGHLTDIHVNAQIPEPSANLVTALSNYKEMHIDTLVVTGDLVDNWGKDTKLRRGHQVEKDFMEYANVTKYLYRSFVSIIDIPGNHDEYGIWRFESEDHNVLRYSDYYKAKGVLTAKDFKVGMTHGKDVIVIMLNPFMYPTPRATFDLWARQTRKCLDMLEAKLAKANTESFISRGRRTPIFVASHFPVSYWVRPNVRSSSGNTLEDILSQSKMAMFLSGHAHPSRSQYAHHNGAIEVIGKDLVGHKAYSIVTVDNGRASHVTYDIKTVPKVILTHPVPMKLLSRNIPFSEKATAIRLISKEDTLGIFIRGDIEGLMQLVRKLDNEWYLYSFPIPSTLSNGMHHIEFYGDWSDNLEFFCGDAVSAFSESIDADANSFTVCVIVFWTAVIFNMIIIAPRGIRIEFGIRNRVLQLPKWLRGMFAFAWSAPIFLPIAFVSYDEGIGLTCLYGYFGNGLLFYDVWGQVICMHYEICIVLCGLILASGLVYDHSMSAVVVVDICVALYGFCHGMYYSGTELCGSTGPALTFLSPLFLFVPIIMYGSLYYWWWTGSPTLRPPTTI